MANESILKADRNRKRGALIGTGVGGAATAGGLTTVVTPYMHAYNAERRLNSGAKRDVLRAFGASARELAHAPRAWGVTAAGAGLGSGVGALIGRKRKVKKRDETMIDYENKPSGFARYGHGSSMGRKQTDEFSKGYWKDVAGTAKAAHKSRAPMPRGTGVDLNDQLAHLIGRDGKPLAAGAAAGVLLAPRRKVEKAFLPPKSELVELSKRIRNKDAEDDRQRRLGMGVAATGLGAGLLLRRGIGGAVKTTRSLRSTEFGGPAGKYWQKASDGVRELVNHTDPATGQAVRGKGLAMTRRQLAETAGGTALGGGAVALEHYSRSRRNRRWE